MIKYGRLSAWFEAVFMVINLSFCHHHHISWKSKSITQHMNNNIDRSFQELSPRLILQQGNEANRIWCILDTVANLQVWPIKRRMWYSIFVEKFRPHAPLMIIINFCVYTRIIHIKFLKRAQLALVKAQVMKSVAQKFYYCFLEVKWWLSLPIQE